MTSFNQVIVGAAAGDAITSMAYEMQSSLATVGPSRIYARYRELDVEGTVGRIEDMPLGRSSDVLIYHASFGDPHVTAFLLARPERLVLVYHNITPSRHYINVDPAFAAGLEWGRHELRLLRDRVVLPIAVSQYNADELVDLGYHDVVVVPLGLRAERFDGCADDSHVLDEIRRRLPDQYIVNVAQILPHKRQDVLVQAIHLLQTCHYRDVGLVLVGTPRSPPYRVALAELVRRLRVANVWFAAGLTDRALGTIVRHAGAYVSASDHEGLGIPPLEAMALGVPTIARDVGAVRETLADASLLLPPHAGPLLFATAVERVLEQVQLRTTMVERGRRRVHELTVSSQVERWLPLFTRLSQS